MPSIFTAVGAEVSAMIPQSSLKAPVKKIGVRK